MKSTPTPNKTKSNKGNTIKTIVVVSLIWIAIGSIVVAFMQNSQAQYNRGVFDGMQKTKNILQAK